MIHQTLASLPNHDWQSELSKAINDPQSLLSMLGLQDKLASLDPELLNQFPLRVTHSYINKMRYGDSQDPLLRQVFPLIDESIEHPQFVSDPVGDHLALTSPGVLQKYQGRALIVATGACAIHCRYCFRRHYPYSTSNPLASQWQNTLDTLQQDTSIKEVILSGGDPLSLSDNKLTALMDDLEAIEHIERLRIHSRLPIVLPHRITNELLACLSNSRFNVVMVIHANHANELVDDVPLALDAIKQSGIALLNQAVLLKGVNNQLPDLINLSEQLWRLGVMPYYLHLLDPVQGAAHFDVSDAEGINLIAQMRKQLSGYLVPRLVREQQGEASKTIIC